MNKTIEHSFTQGEKLVLKLDFNEGTFKIFTEKGQELATASDLKGKTVVPFVMLYWSGRTKLTLIE